MSDEELLQRISQGDSKAFESLFHRHKRVVYGISFRILGAPMLAEENSQDVWMKVVQKSADFKSGGSVRSWILTIAKNQALNVKRKRGWEESLPAESDSLHMQVEGDALDEDLSGQLEKLQDLECLKQAIDQLPDRQRVAVVLWMSEDLGQSDLASALDLSIDSVKALLFRARENLKAMMRNSK